MPTELLKPVTHHVGSMVITVCDEGIRIRGHRRRKSLLVPWKRLVVEGLKCEGYSLTEAEWLTPLDQVPRLARLPRGVIR